MPGDNMRTALVAQTLSNIHRDPKTKPFTLDDFILKTADRRKSDCQQDSVKSLMTFMIKISGKKDG